MSFIDLATMALHRRNEMEARINVFIGKCDQAIQDITKLKIQAKSFVDQLNCDPMMLKERFLNGMKTLDEYIYLITDFNLAVKTMDEAMPHNIEYTPVHDESCKTMLQPTQTCNIMDMLSEPARATSTACSNHCPVPLQKKKVPRDEQSLILFSSTSCSAESVPIGRVEVEKKDPVNGLTEELSKIFIKEESIDSRSQSMTASTPEPCNLPAQTLLQIEQVYPAWIMHVDGPSLWIITDINVTWQLITEMTEYYKANNTTELSTDDLVNLTYCAYYDDENDCFCRGFIIHPTEGESTVVEVFLVDYGEQRALSSAHRVRPLAPRFATLPPAARLCHLAGIEMRNSQELAAKQEAYLRQYVGTHCSIEVDDNSSESVGVYVMLPANETLNELLVQEGLANSTEYQAASSVGASRTGPPELSSQLSLDTNTNYEQYDDPLVAVTGHAYRDEAEICKHYKGQPEKTCFKGANCKKRHVLKHPDGWTLDREEVLGKCRTLPLPAPGTWHRAFVTFIGHYNRLCVQFLKDDDSEMPLPLPEFGTVLPPRTLDELLKDMNSPAARIAYKPLKMMPAPGELVAALYPPDDRWYRARVISYTRTDQNVQVMYIDYGNHVWVREDAIRELDVRFAVLPAQAVQCVLAGVTAKSDDSRTWTTAKHQLEALVQDRAVDIHVIAREYDEITVEIFNEAGISIAEQLAARNVVKLHEYSVIDDSDVTHKLVLP